MHERDRRGCDGLHIVIVPNEGGLGGFSRKWGEHGEAATRWRLWHIAVASCPLANKATVTIAANRKQADALRIDPYWWPEGKAHFMGPLVDAARRGESIPKIRATEQARRYVASAFREPFVTLTVRNQTTDPTRNSFVAEWRRLAAHLAWKRRVVWLDDSNDALSCGIGYAELDPDLRLALYERADMNFIGNNGPQELLKFSGARYRIFLDKAWPEHWKEHFHMSVGDQLPWAGEDQRLVYEPDTFHVMSASWDSGTS